MSGYRLTRWADLLMARFYDAGVRHVVASPGSRSTAFVLAAERHPKLQCHDAIDERVGGFFALGIGRATGQPALLICTSGTAPAHYYPAVIEASHIGIPLLVLSADRPLELVDCAAPQTIDQVKLFGDHVRSYVDLGLPDPAPRALRGTARAVQQAVLASHWPVPGAVHLNARARKPFEPDGPSDEADRSFDRSVKAVEGACPAVYPPVSAPSAEGLEAVAGLCRRHERGVIVAGPASLSAKGFRGSVARLAKQTGYPVLCEGVSQQRFVADRDADVVWVDHFDLLLKSPAFRDGHHPQVVVQIGAPPVSGGVEHWLDAASPARVVLASHGWNDWLGTASHFVFGELSALVAGLAEAVGEVPPRQQEWAGSWRAAESQMVRAVDEVVEAEPVPTEAHAVRALVASLPDDVLFMVGNSLSVRLVDWYTSGTDAAVDVLSQRGANGIDGLISAAAGAIASTGRPCVLLLGDVSAIHDLNGLLMARGLPAPLVVVVVNNGGGRIFDILPVARHPGVGPEALAHLTTPHAVDFQAAAKAYGVSFTRVAPSELPALFGGMQAASSMLVEVPVAADRAAPMVRAIRERYDLGPAS